MADGADECLFSSYVILIYIPNWFVLEDFPSLGNLLQSVDERPEKEENVFDPLYLGMIV